MVLALGFSLGFWFNIAWPRFVIKGGVGKSEFTRL